MAGPADFLMVTICPECGEPLRANLCSYGCRLDNTDPRTSPVVRYDLHREKDAHARLVEAAKRLWEWTGPGWPDLDDPDERASFMADVSKLSAVYATVQRGR